jgi:hypothetical protein
VVNTWMNRERVRVVGTWMNRKKCQSDRYMDEQKKGRS